MAKGLRSKIKRHFRTVKRGNVAKAPSQIEAEKRRQEVLDAILNAPKPEIPAKMIDDESADPCSMETEVGVAGPDLVPLTTKNPAKLARKLKQRRLAASKGITPATKKKAKPLSGANQFHKRKKKR